MTKQQIAKLKNDQRVHKANAENDNPDACVFTFDLEHRAIDCEERAGIMEEKLSHFNLNELEQRIKDHRKSEEDAHNFLLKNRYFVFGLDSSDTIPFKSEHLLSPQKYFEWIENTVKSLITVCGKLVAVRIDKYSKNYYKSTESPIESFEFINTKRELVTKIKQLFLMVFSIEHTADFLNMAFNKEVDNDNSFVFDLFNANSLQDFDYNVQTSLNHTNLWSTSISEFFVNNFWFRRRADGTTVYPWNEYARYLHFYFKKVKIYNDLQKYRFQELTRIQKIFKTGRKDYFDYVAFLFNLPPVFTRAEEIEQHVDLKVERVDAAINARFC
jgi:hypothetical protein